MYWSLLGCIGGVEYAAEWIVSWSVNTSFYDIPSRHQSTSPRSGDRSISLELKLFANFHIFRIPFYYSFKMTFLLYLLLPQTNGTTYIYKNHLEPYLKSHESEIDAWYSQYKAFAYKCLLKHFHTVWNLIAASLGHPLQPETSGASANPTTGIPPPLQTVTSALFNVAGGLCKMYGPIVFAVASVVGKQLAKSARAVVVSVAAQVDAALAAAKESAAENALPKDVPGVVGVVPIFEQPVVVDAPSAPAEPAAPGPPQAQPHIEVVYAPAPAPESPKAPEAPATMPNIHLQAMYTPEQMAHAQAAFTPMPFPNFPYLSSMLAEPKAGEEHVPTQQELPTMMGLPQVPYLNVMNAQTPPSSAHIAPIEVTSGDAPAAPAAEPSIHPAVVVEASDSPSLERDAAHATESTAAPAPPPVTAPVAEAPKEMPPPPPPTAAAAASSSNAVPLSARPQPVLIPLLFAPPVMS